NLKSVEISYLNASLQGKFLEITALKDDLRKLKGKALVDNVVTKHIIDPEMLKIDVEPITHKLLNKKTTRSALSTLKKNLQFSRIWFAKLIQELLTHISKTCPSVNNTDGKLVAVTPKNKDKRHPKLNAISKLLCVKCNGCMFFDNHDLCVLDFINDVNARTKSKSVKKSSKRKVWKPTSRTFTIVGNMFPLTRITTTAEVPLRKPTALESDTPKPGTSRSRYGSISPQSR
ncbi:hypothetical protein Tco_1289246, partial [Tanacetum coccineum]